MYRGRVFDVSGYRDQHPGGDTVEEGYGVDTGAVFDEIGHSGHALARGLGAKGVFEPLNFIPVLSTGKSNPGGT